MMLMESIVFQQDLLSARLKIVLKRLVKLLNIHRDKSIYSD